MPPWAVGPTALCVCRKCECFPYEALHCSISFSSDNERLLKLIAWHSGLSVMSALILLWQNDGRCLSHRVTPRVWALCSSSGSSELKPGCDLRWKRFWGVHGGRDELHVALTQRARWSLLCGFLGAAGGDLLWQCQIYKPQWSVLGISPSFPIPKLPKGGVFESCHFKHAQPPDLKAGLPEERCSCDCGAGKEGESRSTSRSKSMSCGQLSFRGQWCSLYGAALRKR